MAITDCELKHLIFATHCDEKQLNNLILKFKSHIKSQRRCDSIKNVQDLIRILERRAILDIEILRDIVEYLNCTPKRNAPQSCATQNLSEREDRKFCNLFVYQHTLKLINLF